MNYDGHLLSLHQVPALVLGCHVVLSFRTSLGRRQEAPGPRACRGTCKGARVHVTPAWLWPLADRASAQGAETHVLLELRSPLLDHTRGA